MSELKHNMIPGARLGISTDKVEPSTVRLMWYLLSFPKHQICHNRDKDKVEIEAML